MKYVAFALVLAFAGTASAAERTPTAVAVDYASGRVLFCQRCDEPAPPSSMSKLMTLELIFRALKQGELRLGDRLRVSQTTWRYARRTNDAKMGIDVGASVRIDDLLKGMIVQSAGDATIVLAEEIAGSEARFAEMMNRRAGELRLTNSHFANARGVTERRQYMSAADIARLCAHIIRTYPAYYRYFALAAFTWGGRQFYNRNALLGTAGVDGLKTGHTLAGGYGLAASSLRGTRRVIVVVNGQPTERAREREAWRLIELGFERLAGGSRGQVAR
jgi:D-alanyl-D-alanine carboxypeptidase (penicillin-binding protein 5/6)